MKSPDAGTTMVLGAGIGSVVGVFMDNIGMAMAIGAAAGAILGGVLMHIKKAPDAGNKDNPPKESR